MIESSCHCLRRAIFNVQPMFALLVGHKQCRLILQNHFECRASSGTPEECEQ